MPVARSALGGATANCPEGLQGKCVYAVPGTGTPADLAAYSPAVNTWATLPVVKTPRTGPAVTTAPCPPGHRGECVYAVGGTVAGPAVCAVVEAYSVETNAWISLPSVQTARTGAAAATAPRTEGTGLRGSCVYVWRRQPAGRPCVRQGPSRSATARVHRSPRYGCGSGPGSWDP
ncbi:hypothetical protein [Streptomyces sp. NPDC058612]|uniref:hypothetical protein n=1 Tax=Streptomyces sp. NPDC058612 TaxID=3346555 RepID=UPI00365CE499